jgi:hypothetical protein
MSRNKITTTGFPSASDIALCIPLLQEELLQIDKSLCNDTYTYTFQYANSVPHDNALCTTHMHCFIHKTPYSQHRLTEHVAGFRIERFPHTFHQTHHLIRTELYTILQSLSALAYHSILMIGGECYLFPFFFSHVTDMCVYTDTESIAMDVMHNHPTIKAHCAPYSTLKLTRSFNLGIINVGLELPDTVWDTLYCEELIVIRCKPRKERIMYPVYKSWNMDYVTVECCKYTTL